MGKVFFQSTTFRAPALSVMSVILTVATPIATVNAVASPFDSLTALKDKVTTAITANITKLEKSASSLTVNVSVDANGASGSASSDAGSASGSVTKDGASGTASSSNGASASGSVNKDGATGTAKDSKGNTATNTVDKNGASSTSKSSDGSNATIGVDSTGASGSLSVSKQIKDKLIASNQKAIDKLKALKVKVDAQTKLTDIQASAKEYDQQFQDFAIANVQASVTKSIDSMTKTLDHLQIVSNNIQAQVTKVKDCLQGVNANANANSNVTNKGASASASVKSNGCSDLNVDANSGDAADSLQKKLDAVKSTMQTIRSFLSSSIGLISQLKDGNYSGTMTSFAGISSQLDIVASLSANIQTVLVNLSATVSK